jgi:hypothetical protein
VLSFHPTPSEEAFEKELAEMAHEQRDKLKRKAGEEPVEPSILQVQDTTTPSSGMI